VRGRRGQVAQHCGIHAEQGHARPAGAQVAAALRSDLASKEAAGLPKFIKTIEDKSAKGSDSALAHKEVQHMLKLSIPDPTPPRAIARDRFINFDVEIDALLEAPRARSRFNVDGRGLAVAVLDTGLRVTHACFAGRVVDARNFTTDNGGDPENVTDRNGHGTNVAGIIAAGTNDERRGIAPGAKVVPLKVLPAPTFDPILRALQWVLDNEKRLGITVINLSLGAPGVNLQSDDQPRAEQPELAAALAELSARRIAIVVAAGNDYHEFQREGMSVPAIFREVISVGAVYDASVGRREYRGGAVAFTTHADQVTPFTQRLSKEMSPDCYTDVMSAGAAATSAGADNDDATSVQDGTSQAAPTVAGVVLLMQQHYRRQTGELPQIDLLQDVLRSTSVWIHDGDDEDDNVENSGRRYPRVNAFESLVALDRRIKLA
jgi:subtilisin family serine protease